VNSLFCAKNDEEIKRYAKGKSRSSVYGGMPLFNRIEKSKKKEKVSQTVFL
jgi:hypothetical protein